jgi:hypothetical protein
LEREAQGDGGPAGDPAQPETPERGVSKFSKLSAKFYKKKTTQQEADGEFSSFKALKVLEEYKEANGAEWWLKNEFIYPILSRLARRYLAIPASSAPSERVFSKYGVIWEKRKCNLNPETANDIIYLHETRK